MICLSWETSSCFTTSSSCKPDCAHPPLCALFGYMCHVLPEGLHGSCVDAAVEQSTLIVEQSTLTVEPSVQFATSRCLAYLMQELASFQLGGGIRKQVLIVSEFAAGPSAVVDKFLVLKL